MLHHGTLFNKPLPSNGHLQSVTHMGDYHAALKSVLILFSTVFPNYNMTLQVILKSLHVHKIITLRHV